MTEQGAQPYEDLGAWLTDDLFPGWARYWNDADTAPPTVETPKPPWFRNTRVLVGVIAAAAGGVAPVPSALVAAAGGEAMATGALAVAASGAGLVPRAVAAAPVLVSCCTGRPRSSQERSQ